VKERNEMDRTIRAWFEADATHDVPVRLLDSIDAETRRRGPRPAWLAFLRADGIERQLPIVGTVKPLVVLAIVAALLIGLVGGAILAGGSQRGLLSEVPTPSATLAASPTPSPFVPPKPTLTVSGGSLPRVEVPPGFSPTMTPGDLERHVLALIASNERDLSMTLAPAKVSAIRLLPPGTSDPLLWADGSDHGASAFRAERLTWAVDGEGTLLECAPRCSIFAAGTFFFDDEAGVELEVGARGPITAIPSASFRTYLADFGQAFTPGPVPATGVVTAASVLAGLAATDFPVHGARPDVPIYGLVTCVDTTKHCVDAYAGPGKVVAMWWVAFPATPGAAFGDKAWAAVDATNGAFLNGDGPP